MPSLTNGTLGRPGVTALSVSPVLTRAALPLVLGVRVGWECQQGGPRAKPDIIFDPFLHFLLTFCFFFHLWKPKVLDSWEGMQARGRRSSVCGWGEGIKELENRGGWEAGTWVESWASGDRFRLGFVSWANPVIPLSTLEKIYEHLNYTSLISWAKNFEHLLCAWGTVKKKAQFLPLRSPQDGSEGLSLGSMYSLVIKEWPSGHLQNPCPCTLNLWVCVFWGWGEVLCFHEV